MVNEILAHSNRACLQLDPDKKGFASNELNYLGFITNVKEGMKIDPKKIEAITSREAPSNIKEVRSFLGFSNFYRPLIYNFVSISNPLHALTIEGRPFHRGEEHQDSFGKTKRLFTTVPDLKMWHKDCNTVLEKDATGWATGGYLSQYDTDGELYTVANFSKKLTPVACNYNIHDKELLAIIRCLKKWRGELIGLHHHFTIFTDHNSLKYFMSTCKFIEHHVR